MSWLRKILSILTPTERRSAVWLLALMGVGMGLETFGLGLVIPAMGMLVSKDAAREYPALAPLLHRLGDPTQTQLAVGGLFALAGIYVIKGAFLAYLAWRQSRFVYEVQAAMSQRLFAIYLRQSWAFHLRRNSAQLLRNATSELDVFTSSVLMPATSIATEALVALGVTALLIAVEPVGAAVVGVVLGAAALAFSKATNRHIAAWGVARQFHEGRRIQDLQQGLGGAKDVKLLGREDDFLAQYKVHSDACARVGRRQATLLNLPRLGLETLAVVALAVLVLIMLMQGRDLSAIVPALALFAAGAFRLIPSANRLLSAVQAIPYGLPVVNNLYHEFHLPVPAPSTKRPGAHGGAHALQRDIRLVDVEFSYPESSVRTLDRISFTIEKGEFVGFIGPSGSGKSTLVDIILGLLTPSGGQVLVDGVDTATDQRAWQDQIGYVPQTIYLTDDTLRRNVAFGVPVDEIDDAAVARAIRAAQLDEFIREQPEGLETVVGERGVRLSGGQRQRVGIARALYHDPPVLVLDEATSALDTATERDVMTAITALHGTKTILMVAHRLSTFQDCDRLYRLDRGRAVLDPETLARQRGPQAQPPAEPLPAAHPTAH